MNGLRFFQVGAIAVGFMGCATPQEGQLYRRDVAAVSRIRIDNASASSSNVHADLSDGSTCTGRIARADAAPASSFGPELEDATSGAVGVLICRSNAVLHCRFVRRMLESYAYGECVDQQGVKYTAVF